MRKTISAVVGAFLCTLCLVEAQADVIGADMGESGTPYGIDGNRSDWTEVIISGGPFSGGGIPIVQFETKTPGEIITVSFTANCQMTGSPYSRLYLRFTVDGLSMLPRYPELCLGRSTALGPWNDINTVTAFMKVQTAGVHYFRVDARVTGSGLSTINASGEILGSTTIIQN